MGGGGGGVKKTRGNRLRRPLVGLSGLQCLNMGHYGHGKYLYSVVMILIMLMGNLLPGGQSNLGHLRLLPRHSPVN